MNLSRRPVADLACASPHGRKQGGAAAGDVRDRTGRKVRVRSDPLSRFKQQRWRALDRGVGWEMTFDEWMKVWLDSGHWHERGIRAGGYVMGRKGDVGPYSVDNVQIIPHEQNISDGSKNNPGCVLKKTGSGRGWTYVARATRRPYQVVVSRKYIGCFATQAEAEAAYELAVRSHVGDFLARRRESAGRHHPENAA